MATSVGSTELHGTIRVAGHDVATFTLDVPITVIARDDMAGLTIQADPIGPLLAEMLREMAGALEQTVT